MDAAAHLGFTLNIYHSAPPHIGPGCNPGRAPKSVSSGIDYIKPVYLPYYNPAGIDKYFFLGEHFLDLFLQPVGAVDLLPERLVNMTCFHVPAVFRLRPGSRLVDNLDDFVKPGGELS